MNLGYNTNGLAHHDLFDAIELLAEIGYRSVAITLDHGPLAPDNRDLPASLARLRRALRVLGLRSVLETGGRFLLDPREKHEPTLVSPDPAARARRIAFYQHAIRCAAELECDCVSIWSGRLRQGDPEVGMERLAAGLEQVLDYAAARGVAIGFEPEPGMLIDTLEGYERLRGRVGPRLRLTLDIGHLQCQGELPLAATIARAGPQLVNVHLEDMRRDTHEHLMFGEGEIDFPEALAALAATGYAGGVHVELSRHSHEAPTAARRAFEFLRPLAPWNLP